MEIVRVVKPATGIYALQTQQCRLRHLHSLAARNVQLKKRRTSLDVTQLQMFFTLHRDAKSSPFYTSEKIRGSLNPVWKSFSLVHLSEENYINTISQSLTIRVWCGQACQAEVDYFCCLRWDVQLSGLIHLGSKILTDGNQYSPNTLIFGLRDAFYGAPSEDKDSTSLRKLKTFAVDSELSLIRESYSTRLQTVLRALKQTQRVVTKERRTINTRLLETENLRHRKAECELTSLKVNMMRNDLHWRINQLQSLEKSYELLNKENLSRDATIKKKHKQLVDDSEILHERKKKYFDVRDDLIKTGAQLVIRRKQLLSELAFIYPIQRLPNNEDRICIVHLPHSEAFAGHDETQIAVALGHTCHLVMMISNFLDIPLRYPMDHRGSRSMIRDHVITKLSERERNFPLFSKGKEKYQFQYGVFIMNKNIAQLRHYCGMTTSDLRQTLANISTLLCDRLGVTVNRNDAFTNQHFLIPPSFGGPQKSSHMTHHSHAPLAAEASNETSALSSWEPSLCTNQIDPRLQEIAEETPELHSNTLAVGESGSQEEGAENFKPEIVDHASENSELILKCSSANHNPQVTEILATAGKATDFIPPVNHIIIYSREDDSSSCPTKDLRPSPERTDSPSTDDVDVSSIEDADSKQYCSHFGKLSADELSIVISESQGHVETAQGAGSQGHVETAQGAGNACGAGVNGVRLPLSNMDNDVTLKSGSEPYVDGTFKTWGRSGKEWEKQWTTLEAEDNGSVKTTDKLSGASDEW